MSFDLSAERAKRSKESKHFEMRGDDGEVLDKFVLLPDLPLDALDVASDGFIGRALMMLFEDQAEGKRFLKDYRPTVADFNDIVRGLYGIEKVGEL